MPQLGRLTRIRESDFISDGLSDQRNSLWGRISTSPRDLPAVTQERMFNIALTLYRINPVAHRILELTRDFVVAEGISFSAEDPKVDAVMRNHWYDPINKWNARIGQRVFELGLYGELFMPIKINENGDVRFSYRSPLDIKDVKVAPDNLDIVREIVLHPGLILGTDTSHVLKHVNIDEDPESPTYNLRTGECFFVAVNKVSDARRGTSDLLSLCDIVDAYDQFVFNRLERANFLNMWMWDIQLTGSTQAECDARA